MTPRAASFAASLGLCNTIISPRDELRHYLIRTPIFTWLRAKIAERRESQREMLDAADARARARHSNAGFSFRFHMPGRLAAASKAPFPASAARPRIAAELLMLSAEYFRQTLAHGSAFDTPIADAAHTPPATDAEFISFCDAARAAGR